MRQVSRSRQKSTSSSKEGKASNASTPTLLERVGFSDLFRSSDSVDSQSMDSLMNRKRTLLDAGMASAIERISHDINDTHGDGRVAFDLSADCAQAGYRLTADGVLMGSCLFAVALSFSDSDVFDESGFQDGVIKSLPSTIASALNQHDFVSEASDILTVPALFSYDDLGSLSLRDVGAMRKLLESNKGDLTTRFAAPEVNGDAGLKLVELGSDRLVRWVVGLASWTQSTTSPSRPQWLENGLSAGCTAFNDLEGFMETASQSISLACGASIEVGLPAPLMCQVRNAAANEVANSLVSLCSTLRACINQPVMRLKVCSFNTLTPKEQPTWDALSRVMVKVLIAEEGDWFVAGNFEFDCLMADAQDEISDLVEIAETVCGIGQIDSVQHDELGQSLIVCGSDLSDAQVDFDDGQFLSGSDQLIFANMTTADQLLH